MRAKLLCERFERGLTNFAWDGRISLDQITIIPNIFTAERSRFSHRSDV